MSKSSEPTDRLRVLIADHGGTRLQQVADTVAALGHEALVQEGALQQIAAVTRRQSPDVAIVIVGESSERALRLIGSIVREAACPVIAILDVEDPEFIRAAAKRGLFAYISEERTPNELRGAIDIALSRFAAYHNLEGAFARRAVTERAKGILMERHSIDEQAAFALLRNQARASGRKIVDIAEAVLSSHLLLSAQGGDSSPDSDPDPSVEEH